MGEYSIKQEIGVPAQRLWDLAADFGNVGWIQGLEKVEVKGDGPGMVRIVNGAIHEKLETLDPARRVLTYTIGEGLPFPVKNYHSTMKIEAAGADRCSLEWTCRAEPDGVTDEQVGEMIRGMYTTMIGWITDYLDKS